MRKFAVQLCALAGIFGILAGCGGGGAGSTSLTTRPDVKFVNAVVDSTALDFTVDNTTAASSVAYGTATTGFKAFDPKDYDFGILEHGQNAVLWNESFTLATAKDTIAVAVGEENFGTESTKRARFVFVDVNRLVPNGNKSRLIVVNAFNRAVGSETPGIDFQNPGDNPLFKLTNIASGASQSFDVDSGSQDFQARNTGTDLVYAESTQTLAPGKIYLVLVTGVEGGTGVQAPNLTFIPVETKAP